VSRALPPAIAAHRLISDGRTAALVRGDGEIDWWCAPRLDSPPLAWSLLDAGGGFLRWRGARLVHADGTPAGPSARTVLRVPGGRVECRDAVLSGMGNAGVLVRLVRALDAPVAVTAELRLGGFDGPWATWTGGCGSAGETLLRLATDTEAEADFEAGTLTLKAQAGAWAGLAVVAGSRELPEFDTLRTQIDEAGRRFRTAIAGARLPRLHPQRATDALTVLKACTFPESGAIVAAPTTSLPEVPGGDRQWDYRYCWLRDAGLAASVAALLGDRQAASGYLSFVKSLAGTLPLRPVVTVDGGDVPEERIVPGVSGWAGSRPVRVGNAAAAQLQFDVLGLVLEAVSVFLQTGGRLDAGTWALVRTVADHVADAPEDPSNGIWELREPRRLISADIGRWLALDRAIWIARGWRPLARRSRWKAARQRVRRRVLRTIGPDGRLSQGYDDHTFRSDASALMIPMFGMIGRRDARAHRLVDAILEDLGSGPFLYRYEPDGHDAFSPGEGAFLPVCWWAVSALAAVGRVDGAQERLEELCRRLPRLLPEEVDPTTGEGLGNVPLVWSHAEAARSLYVVDAALRRARWGAPGLWAWRLGRYARLRWAPATH
jgi:GH15 family glucan-1,4-alpha-glucosidase